MSAPKTFEHDTWLYHAADGARLFLASQEQPGDGWFDHPQNPTAALVGAAPDGRVAELETQLADQRAKFDTAWAEISKDKKSLEDENGDLRGEVASKDEDIRQLKATIAKFDPDGDGKPGGGVAKPSK